MIQKLLIANRGEVAMRVIRTAKQMGIGTVAVHSEVDARALHVQAADERVDVGPPAHQGKYLKVDQIMQAARDTGADAIHPGYGFLSENAALARACREAGLIFIGPNTAAIAALGQKVGARAVVAETRVPVVPGSGALADVEVAVTEARRLGYPVLLKASAGGSGVGMERVDNEAELRQRFEPARATAAARFASDTIYIERFLDQPRHVEVQIAADRHGNVVQIGERDCTIQRRHQKLLEESPSPSIDQELREQMQAAAVTIARHVGFDSVGTVEMLVSGGQAYFLEMNTRLQIGHPVTEVVSGLDLVEWQLRLAMGEELPAKQEEIHLEGHAILCRIYAEDPAQGFAPSPGRLTRFAVPTGPWVRNDIGVLEGDPVAPFYDPMIAKLIVHGPDRQTTIERLRAALSGYLIEGVVTNLELHQQIIADETFLAGTIDTGFLRDRLGLEA